MEIFKTTLLPMSIYGFSTTVAGILFSTSVGSLVDSTPRLPAVQSFLLTQKSTTVLGALGFWVLLTWFDPTSALDSPILATPVSTTAAPAIGVAAAISAEDDMSMTLSQGYSLFTLLILMSGTLKLSALGWSISIERDWVVALCQSDSDMLTKINVTMKRIDLVCKLVSPLVFAALLAQFNAGYCSLAMAVWCMFSFSAELVLVRRIWFTSPVLWQPRSVARSFGTTVHHRDRTPKRKHRQGAAVHRSIGSLDDEEQDLIYARIEHGERDHTGAAGRRQRRERSRSSFFWQSISSFREYTHHIVFLASLSYAIIYINMMSVSGTMIGYLQWRGFSASTIALLKGICTLSELLGTILMPILTRYLGLVRAGAWSIWLEVLTLTPVLLSIYSERLPVQAMVFAGMALSRVGVWSFDLIITQIMQEFIDPSPNSLYSSSTINNSNAGVINGWHYSMMSLFELGQFFLTMIWSDPQVYFIPCTLSFACVVVGAIVYSAHLVRMRGHLFHYQRIASAATSSCFLTESDQEEEREGEGEDEGEGVQRHDAGDRDRGDNGQPGPSRRSHVYIHRVSDPSASP
ncbi:Ferroporti-1 [Gamsiella multidivaricata]|uniref:Ferroporti-1 n=1 Tax=Gamsiella multidivaricata TaxID=101098 RepID=UPI002220B429|nr:Ferroporti-1 [Gamsiella multidivaricata]KAI7826084.1 Ferroporti-1 [Gamsiella multidivaricata]